MTIVFLKYLQKESLEEPDSLLVKVKSPSPLRAKSVLANVRVVRTTTLILYFQNPGSTNANTSFEIYL